MDRSQFFAILTLLIASTIAVLVVWLQKRGRDVQRATIEAAHLQLEVERLTAERDIGRLSDEELAKALTRLAAPKEGEK